MAGAERIGIPSPNYIEPFSDPRGAEGRIKRRPYKERNVLTSLLALDVYRVVWMTGLLPVLIDFFISLDLIPRWGTQRSPHGSRYNLWKYGQRMRKIRSAGNIVVRAHLDMFKSVYCSHRKTPLHRDPYIVCQLCTKLKPHGSGWDDAIDLHTFWDITQGRVINSACSTAVKLPITILNSLEYEPK